MELSRLSSVGGAWAKAWHSGCMLSLSTDSMNAHLCLGAPKTVFRLHDLPEDSQNLVRYLHSHLQFVTIKGNRLKSATEKGAEARLWEAPVKASGPRITHPVVFSQCSRAEST